MSNHEYRKGAHTAYRLHYHFVFVPKYRKPVLRDAVGVRVRDLVRQRGSYPPANLANPDGTRSPIGSWR